MTCIIVTLFAVACHAQTLTTLHSFSGASDGAFPSGALVQGTDGTLYGTTSGGLGEGEGNGTIFKLSPSGVVTSLYSFCAKSGCPDGSLVAGGLTEGPDGNFYGTTNSDGANGAGTVFKITPLGVLTTLYSFCAQAACTDGLRPDMVTLLYSGGFFYGTTQGGGTGAAGTIFKITPNGVLTTLYSFCSEQNCADGRTPVVGLSLGANGLFYGETNLGGANQQGTIYEISAAGSFKLLYTFCSQPACADGSEPIAGLVQASDGNFYGTTSGLGGQSTPSGTIFRITPAGTLTTLHVFDHTDGSWAGTMMQATDGNLYGTTWNGGLFEGGTLFKLALDGTFATLYNFCSASSCTDGQTPIAGLLQRTDGTFYGTTELGGTQPACDGFDCGTLYSLSVGLGPFIETRPTFGKMKTKVIILGDHLTGTTKVTFAGTAAKFVVVSDSEIDAVVPAGATTGPVNVVTPTGSLHSNAAFRVQH